MPEKTMLSLSTSGESTTGHLGVLDRKEYMGLRLGYRFNEPARIATFIFDPRRWAKGYSFQGLFGYFQIMEASFHNLPPDISRRVDRPAERRRRFFCFGLPLLLPSLSSAISRAEAQPRREVCKDRDAMASRRTTTMATAGLGRRFRGCPASRRVEGPVAAAGQDLAVSLASGLRATQNGGPAASGGELVRLGKKWWRLVLGGEGAGLPEQRRRRRERQLLHDRCRLFFRTGGGFQTVPYGCIWASDTDLQNTENVFLFFANKELDMVREHIQKLLIFWKITC
ncbi:unnamed protein product [Miscanthus lutarioriparius]|uniref:Uncharacterized protein n=1 Tax=Miscanthus lutarioriparius TaxID=422564 RepID=A0A811QH42_9POAL|nr:unnamed protein product [Miscanthus lutarioriparius]